jgi:type VI protein secretion system component VasF
MENIQYEQLRETLSLRILPELREVRRRQKALQTTVWISAACLLSGMVALLGMVGVLVGR